MKQITNTILMIRPVAFRMNEQTKVNNYFQEDLDLKYSEINAKAQLEFDTFVTKLRGVGVEVICFIGINTLKYKLQMYSFSSTILNLKNNF